MIPASTMPNFPLPANHHAETLAAHSPAVVLGHACAVTGESLRAGDTVVVCDAVPGRAPITTAGWSTLSSCPHCGASTGLVAAYVPPTWAGTAGWGAPPTPPPAAERERSPALVKGLVGLFLVATLAIAVAVFLFVVRTRDAADAEPTPLPIVALTATAGAATAGPTDDDRPTTVAATCLLYTSDAADERSSVDLGGRRIITKKTHKKKKKNDTQAVRPDSTHSRAANETIV